MMKKSILTLFVILFFFLPLGGYSTPNSTSDGDAETSSWEHEEKERAKLIQESNFRLKLIEKLEEKLEKERELIQELEEELGENLELELRYQLELELKLRQLLELQLNQRLKQQENRRLEIDKKLSDDTPRDVCDEGVAQPNDGTGPC